MSKIIHGWERAGFVNPDRGTLHWSGEPITLFVPTDIRILDSLLVWNHRAPGTMIDATDRLLGEFISLADDENGGRVVSFAKKWGVLELCKHLVPPAHNSKCRSLRRAELGFLPLEAWYAYARMARAVLNVGADLSVGKLSSTDWKYIDSDLDPEFKLPRHDCGFQSGIEAARWHFGRLFNARWMYIGAVRPGIWSVGETYKFTLGPADQTLFGTIAFQLASALCGGPGLACCFACSAIYRPVRRIRADQRNYCQTCGKGAANRAAVRDFRVRKKNKSEPSGTNSSHE